MTGPARRRRRRWLLHLRRASRFTVIVAAAVAAGAICVGFAKLCDGAMALHASLIARSAVAGAVAAGDRLPAGGLAHPALRAGGVGQRHPAGDRRAGRAWTGGRGGRPVTLRTAAFKVLR